MKATVADPPLFRKILASTDFSKSANVGFHTALALSMKLGASLFVLHVLDVMQTIEEVLPGSTERLDKADKSLAGLVGEATTAGVACHADIEEGIPAEIILSKLRNESMDLAVLGTRAIHGIERFIFGSTAETVLRKAPCPVLTVGPMVRNITPVDHGPVIFATDFHETTAFAICYATSLSSALDSMLHCLHVLPRSLQGDGTNEIIPQVLKGALRQIVRESVATIREPVCSVIYGSEVSHAVVEYARQNNAKLIVLGVRQASIMAAHEPAHIAYRIIAEAPCPVLTKAFPWQMQSLGEKTISESNRKGETRTCLT